MISSTSVEPNDRWQRFCREATRPLKKVRKGTRVRNVVSKERGMATERVNRECPFVRVRVNGKDRETTWFAWHVRIDDSKKNHKKKKQ